MAGKGQGEGAGISCTVGEVGNPPLLSWRQCFLCRAKLVERHHLKWLSPLCPVLYFLLTWMGLRTLNVPGHCWCLAYQDGSKTMFWLRGTPGLLWIQVSILYDTTDQLSCYTQGGPTRDGCLNWTLKEQKSFVMETLNLGNNLDCFTILCSMVCSSLSHKLSFSQSLRFPATPDEQPKEAFLLPSSRYHCPVPAGSFRAIPQALLRSKHLPEGVLIFLRAHNKNIGILFVVSSFIF